MQTRQIYAQLQYARKLGDMVLAAVFDAPAKVILDGVNDHLLPLIVMPLHCFHPIPTSPGWVGMDD